MQYILIVFIFLGQFQAASQQSDFLKEADSLNAVGKTSAAIALLESNSDQSEKTLLRLAEYQKKSNLKEAALANYQQVLQMNPNRVLTAMDYGELLLDTDKPEAAKKLFSELSEKYPENASFRFRLGLAREKLQDSSAIDDFYRTVELDSTHQGALYKTSKYELRNGRHFNAAALAKKGLEVNANNASLLSILGQSYMVSFQFE
ncbi:MAG: tetratricopeptide repeat protein, partial [Christiangramia sp.]